jgi:hypothetical protein
MGWQHQGWQHDGLIMPEAGHLSWGVCLRLLLLLLLLLWWLSAICHDCPRMLCTMPVAAAAAAAAAVAPQP